jgi:hypothetical protein
MGFVCGFVCGFAAVLFDETLPATETSLPDGDLLMTQ